MAKVTAAISAYTAEAQKAVQAARKTDRNGPSNSKVNQNAAGRRLHSRPSGKKSSALSQALLRSAQSGSWLDDEQGGNGTGRIWQEVTIHEWTVLRTSVATIHKPR